MNIIFNIVHHDGFFTFQKLDLILKLVLEVWRMAKVTALFTSYFYVP
jgi:hypothetical protein